MRASSQPQCVTAAPAGADAGVPVPDGLIARLTSATRVAIVSHVKPDGDAFGAALGLSGFLRAAGRATLVAGLDPVPAAYAFLRGLDDVVAAAAYVPVDGDLLAICDCGAPDRLPPPLREHAARLPSVCIDHHKSNSGFADVTYIDPAASSTAEMVWRIGCRAGWPLDEPTAEALWVGVLTDTGRFAYDCTSPATLRCAADLLERGRVRIATLTERVYGQIAEAQLRLQARAIASLRRADDGRIALIALTRQDYADCGATTVDSENFVDLARALRGVEMAAFLYAGEDGRVTRLSLRTVPPWDASEFCRLRGGGGHARAAGATLPMPVERAREQVLADLQAWRRG